MKLLFDREAADKGRRGCFQSTGQMAQMLCIAGQWKCVCVEGGGGPGWDGPVRSSSFWTVNNPLFIFLSSLNLKHHLSPDMSHDEPLLFQLFSHMLRIK